MLQNHRSGTKHQAQTSEVIEQVTRVTHNLEGDTVEIALYESTDSLYLYETLKRSQTSSDPSEAQKPAPIRRRVTLNKAEGLCEALRCSPNQEAMVLARDLENAATLSDLLELLMAADCPYTLENFSLGKAR